MALDHFVSQVHLKNFYAPALGGRMMHAMRKTDLKRYRCDAHSQCRIEDGSTNPYLVQPRVVEEFLKLVEPRYNAAVAQLRSGRPDREDIYAIAGFAAYVQTCSPGAMRMQSVPIQTSLEATAKLLDSLGKIPAPPPELGSASLTELLESRLVKVSVDPKYPQSMGIQNILKSTSIWGNSTWDVLLNTDPNSPFFTSDFPVAIELGARTGFVNRIVPLAPDIAIRITPDTRQRGRVALDFPDFRMRTSVASRQQVLQINRAIVQCAESVVYFSQDHNWIPGFIEKNRGFRIEPTTTQVPQGDSQLLISSLRIGVAPATE